MAIFGGFLANNGLIQHVVHKICNYNIIFRKLDTFLVKMIPISTCYTSGRGTIKIFWAWPLHYCLFWTCLQRLTLQTTTHCCYVCGRPIVCVALSWGGSRLTWCILICSRPAVFAARPQLQIPGPRSKMQPAVCVLKCSRPLTIPLVNENLNQI